MKNYRQAKIRELISSRSIYNQQELQDALGSEGITVTQPTLSRDINELGLIKVRDEFGKYKYQLHKNDTMTSGIFFSDTVLSVQTAMNIVVLKCKPGAASGNCAMLDSLDMEGVIGTIAGDDTIFIATKDVRFAEQIKNRLLSDFDIG